MAKITVYGAEWCGDCLRSMHFLNRHDVAYEYVDIGDDPALSQKIVELNIQAGFGPRRRIPIILVGEHVLSEPTNDELGRILGIDGH